jgi:pimeloyl-ACP methyl ester carboxylesterase
MSRRSTRDRRRLGPIRTHRERGCSQACTRSARRSRRGGANSAPTLVPHGSVDPCYAPSHREEIANGVADCRGFVLVEGGAHFLSLTDPEPVNTALQELFEALA